MQYSYGGKVLLPNSAPWLETWLFEMIAFPDGQYNDQVDSHTQIVSFFERVILSRLCYAPKLLLSDFWTL